MLYSKRKEINGWSFKCKPKTHLHLTVKELTAMGMPDFFDV